MKLHDEIYAKGSETILSSQLMPERGKLFQGLEDNRLAIETFQKVEQMHEGMTRCGDREVIRLNLAMALSHSKLGQNDRSLDYSNRALCLSLKTLGEHNISVMSFSIYMLLRSNEIVVGMTRPSCCWSGV